MQAVAVLMVMVVMGASAAGLLGAASSEGLGETLHRFARVLKPSCRVVLINYKSISIEVTNLYGKHLVTNNFSYFDYSYASMHLIFVGIPQWKREDT